MTQTLTGSGAVQIGLRLDVATAELLQAAAAAEGIPRLATYLRLAVRTHVVQSRSIPPDLQSNLAARIGGPNLPGHLQQYMQNQSAEALPVVISDDAQP
ncbi:MAG: hypothetical protein ACKO8I_15905 [Cyanobacteriota bacterium]